MNYCLLFSSFHTKLCLWLVSRARVCMLTMSAPRGVRITPLTHLQYIAYLERKYGTAVPNITVYHVTLYGEYSLIVCHPCSTLRCALDGVRKPNIQLADVSVNYYRKSVLICSLTIT